MTNSSGKLVPRKNCPICMADDVVRHVTAETITDRSGKTYVLDSYEYSSCAKCNAEFVTADQARSNERQLADARRIEQRLLTTSQIVQIRKLLGLRQEDASKIFGGGANAFSKYELGHVTQSVAMDRLLRVTAKFPETVLPFLEELVGTKSTVKRKAVTSLANFATKKGPSQEDWFVTEDGSVLRAANAPWDPSHATKRPVQSNLSSLEETYSEKELSSANG